MIHRGKQVIFARKISQNSLLGNTDRIGHILHRSTVVATLGNQSHGGIENFLPAFPGDLRTRLCCNEFSDVISASLSAFSPLPCATTSNILGRICKTVPKHNILSCLRHRYRAIDFSVYASSLTPGTRRGASGRRGCRTEGPPALGIPSRSPVAARTAWLRGRGPECWPWPRTPLLR